MAEVCHSLASSLCGLTLHPENVAFQVFRLREIQHDRVINRLTGSIHQLHGFPGIRRGFLYNLPEERIGYVVGATIGGQNATRVQGVERAHMQFLVPFSRTRKGTPVWGE